MTFVLDNSVAMRWCFEPRHLYAESILDRLAAGEEAEAPILWYYQASSVLSRAQTRGMLTGRKADEFIIELQSLSIRCDPQSAARVFPDVHQLALTYRLTSYDAAYLELALRRGLPIATLDDDLRRASKSAGVAVL